ncbi:MAG: 23S rRNA (adenine(2030)-N(6))-methyltransferase RlmJ [Pseudolabrys sp.]
MNYRHEFHAGNFADVFKHAVLCRILWYLRGKPAAFRVIDTHAGAGLYDLTSDAATRGGEWHRGIERLLSAKTSEAVEQLLTPYLDVIGALNQPGRLTIYPGSPALVRAWLRPQDRLTACELEPKARVALARNLRGDSRIKTLGIDGWVALNAYVPPKERRGLVFIDPPFEDDSDFSNFVTGLGAAYRKWATGIYALWYPIKGRREADLLAKRLVRLGLGRVLRAEILVEPLGDPGRLNGAGMILVNPPWTLESELSALLPALIQVFGGAGKPGFRLDWLTAQPAPDRH